MSNVWHFHEIKTVNVCQKFFFLLWNINIEISYYGQKATQISTISTWTPSHLDNEPPSKQLIVNVFWESVKTPTDHLETGSRRLQDFRHQAAPAAAVSRAAVCLFSILQFQEFIPTTSGGSFFVKRGLMWPISILIHVTLLSIVTHTHPLTPCFYPTPHSTFTNGART